LTKIKLGEYYASVERNMWHMFKVKGQRSRSYGKFIYLNFGARTKYKVKTKKIISNSIAVTGHKTSLEMPQHKHAQKNIKRIEIQICTKNNLLGLFVRVYFQIISKKK